MSLSTVISNIGYWHKEEDQYSIISMTKVLGWLLTRDPAFDLSVSLRLSMAMEYPGVAKNGA